ncbi:MAG TPA: ATP-binding protein [Candidatus Saccharimonadales bacterium]|nr:ATP-binding protein [Candidatus Saccharimonadales bacterium]
MDGIIAMLGFGPKKSKALPKQQELSTEFLLSAIVDGVVLVGEDNTIHMFSPAASAITGWPVSEAVGLDYRSVLKLNDEHGQPYVAERDPFAQALRSHSTIKDAKGLLSTRGGKQVPVSLIVSPVIVDVHSMTTGVLGVFRDITAERLEDDRRSDFVSTASHELRTPIAAIEGYLALALNPKAAVIDERARNYLQKAHNSTRHLSQLFVDLLASSQAEDGRLSSYPSVVELGEILEQIVDTARFNAQNKGLELRYVLNAAKGFGSEKVIRPLFYVYVDPNRIREVFQNLVDNSIKYTSEGSVTIALTGDNSIAQVHITDTGIGIAEEDIPHLFQKFYRVDNSMTRTVGGTGLGLFISRKVIELYSGRIWVESVVGKGSTFFINLPRLSPEQALQSKKSEASTIRPLGNS